MEIELSRKFWSISEVTTAAGKEFVRIFCAVLKNDKVWVKGQQQRGKVFVKFKKTQTQPIYEIDNHYDLIFAFLKAGELYSDIG